MARAFWRALETAGMSRPARIAIIAMTVSSSIRVKKRVFFMAKISISMRCMCSCWISSRREASCGQGVRRLSPLDFILGKKHREIKEKPSVHKPNTTFFALYSNCLFVGFAELCNFVNLSRILDFPCTEAKKCPDGRGEICFSRGMSFHNPADFFRVEEPVCIPFGG